MPLAALHTPWLESSLALVSGWATNPKLIKSLQPARRGQSRRERRGARSSLGRSLSLRARPRPRPGPEAPRPPARPLLSLGSRPQPPPRTPGRAARSRHRSRPLPGGRALHRAGPAPHPGPAPRTPPPSARRRLLAPHRRLCGLRSAPRPVARTLSGPPFPRRRGKERTFLTVSGARGGARRRSPFTTTCGCAAWLTAAPRRSRGGHSGDGVGLGVLGSVARCGASVRDGPGMRLPGPGSGLGGPPCGRARGSRSQPRGALRPRLVATARPLDTAASAPSAAGAPARGPRRGVASRCSCWGRPAAAVTVSPRIRR